MVKGSNPLPVDRGYAWVIVLAAFTTYIISAGGLKLHGIFLVELTERYEEIYQPSALLWVFTVPFLVGPAASPLIGYLIVKLGHRIISIIGVLALTASYVGLAYAWNLTTLILFFSIPTGLGIDGLIISAMLVSGQYFNKRKALAMGLIAGGSGLGVFILPNVLRALFEHMDFSGALLFYAGLNLQFLCFAALLRPITYYENHNGNKLVRSELQASDSEPLTEKMETDDSQLLGELEFRGRSVTLSHRPSQGEEKFMDSRLHHSTSHLEEVKRESLTQSRAPSKSIAQFSIGHFGGSAIYVPTLSTDKVENSPQSSIIKERISCGLLLMPKYILICTSITLAGLAWAIIYSCIPALGHEQGVPKEHVAMAMAFSGLVEIPCRIANGVIADRKFISCTAQYTLCLFGAGVLTFLPTLLKGLPGVISALLGTSTMATSMYSLLPFVLKELIGEENLTNGLSIQNTLHIIPTLTSSIAAGAIYNSTGSWRYIFYYISGTFLLSSMVMWPYLAAGCCQKKTTQKNQGNENTCIKEYQF